MRKRLYICLAVTKRSINWHCFKKAIFQLFVLAAAVCVLSSSITAAAGSLAPDNTAQASLLVEMSSGEVLHEKNADTPMLIASTTKIMTALITLENCSTQEKLIIDEEFPLVEGSSMGLKPGEEVSVMDLLYGMLLASGNDAALALALHVTGSLEAFAAAMNERAGELGCKNTHFSNPHGLDADNQYSSARDLSLIAREAMENSVFRSIVSTKHITAAGRLLKNHNKLLWSYPGALGIKTGFTQNAGRTLVSCAERDGMQLLCVTLNDPNDWRDHTALFDWAFGSFQCIKLSCTDDNFCSVPIISGEKETIRVCSGEEYSGVFEKSDKIDIILDIRKFVYAPVRSGQTAGAVIINRNGETIKSVRLCYSETVELDKTIPLSPWEKVKWFWYRANQQTALQTAAPAPDL